MFALAHTTNLVRKGSVVVAPLVLTSLIGCNHFFGNDKKVTDPLVMKDQSLSCVRTVGDRVSTYLKGSDDSDPADVADCLSRALKKFAADTRGRTSATGWTRSELATFFETYFKAEAAQARSVGFSGIVNLTDALTGSSRDRVMPFDEGLGAQDKRRAIIDEVFRWKAVLLGGSEQTLTRNELERAQAILDGAREPLSGLKGVGDVLSMRRDQKVKAVSIADLAKIATSIRQIVRVINHELGRTDVVHSSMTIQSLALALEQTKFNFLETKERRELAENVKVLLVGGEAQVVSGREWTEILTQLSEILVATLRLKFGVFQNERLTLDGSDLLNITVAEGAQSLMRSIARHGGQIGISTISAVVVSLEKANLLPMGFHAVSINQTLGAVLGKLLSGAALPGAAENALGLSAVHLKRITEFVEDWNEGQHITAKLFAAGGARESLRRLRLEMARLASEPGSTARIRARRQMLELLSTGRPIVFSDADRVRLDIRPETDYSELQAADFDALNVIRVLVSMALSGYAKEPSRAGNLPRVTEDEAQEIFLGLKAIGHDMGIVDVRSLTAGIRTFMETNLFLSVSDGDRFISFHETVEWLHLVRSAGKVADLIHGDLVSHCGTTELDVFGKKKLQVDCFRERAWSSIEKQAPHLTVVQNGIKASREQKPGFLNWVQRLPKARKGLLRSLTPLPDLKGLMTTLERASRPIGDVDLPIESSELRVMMPILHYVESLFARFDVDRSGLLEEQEVWGIFPLARPFIQKIAGEEVGETYERAIFSWLIIKGYPPENTISGKAALTAWIAAQHFYAIDADIEDVLRVLASFQKASREQKNKTAIERVMADSEMWEAGIRLGDPTTIASIRDTFQCAQDADVGLKSILQLRRSDLFAVMRTPDKDVDERAKEFVAKLKSILYGDQELPRYCQMF
ncbi:MAG: hypothetical protein JNJ49_08200 [Bdellovibrionaceae bacterium]|nr:hypothetical protein [Pseudobdellovibrionaceae bacterium]